jgi:heat shock protein HslJ
MSDEQMDARLRAAGERWRAGTAMDEASLDEPIELQPARPSRPHRTLAMVSAAAVVVALTIGAVLFAVNRGSTSSPAAGGDPTRALEGVIWSYPHGLASLVFVPGGVKISGNCFVRTHVMNASGNQFELGHGVGPLWLCGGFAGTPAMRRAEERFSRVMGHGAIAWSLRGNELRLSRGADDVVLSASAELPVRLDGQTWNLDTVNEPGGRTDRNGYGATLKINRDGTFVANDSCNTLNGSVQTSLASLAFTNVSASANGCTEPAPVRPVIDTLLNGTTGFLINGDQLILRRDGYRGALYYQADAPEPSTSQRIGRTWLLTSINSQRPSVSVEYTITDKSMSDSVDDGAPLRLTASSIQFTGTWVNGLAMTAKPRLSIAETRTVTSILSGRVSWSVSGDQLRISHGTTGVLTFKRQ